jgi:hypothetical protein
MRIPRVVAVLIAAVALPLLARADEVQVTSSTQYLRYTDFLSPNTEQQDIAQYLRLGASFGEKGAIRVQGYGRLVGQLTDSVEPRNELAKHLTGRLYYLFLDYRDLLPDHLDLLAGRTFVGAGAIPAIVDGVQLTGRNLGAPGLGVTAFGGRRVFLDDKSELPFDDDYVLGGSVFLDTAMLSRGELSYAREYRSGRLARDLAAVDLSTTPSAMISLNGRAAFDLVSSRASELRLGVKVAPIALLVLSAEAYQSAPSFDRDSFYRFFGVEQYRQLSLGAEYRFGSLLKVFGSYAYERFDSSEHANLLGAGFTLRPIERFFLNASYEHRSGYAGRLGGLRASAGYVYALATLQAGADYDDFKRQDSRDGNAKKYWAGLNLALDKTFAMSLRAERDENFQFNHSYQGYVLLDVHL